MRLAITAGQESNSDSSNTDQRRVSSEMGRSLGRGPAGGLRFAAGLLVFLVMLSALPGRFYLAAARDSVRSAKSVHWPDLFFCCISHFHCCVSGFQRNVVWNGPSGYSKTKRISSPDRVPQPSVSEKRPPKTSFQ